MVLQLNNPFRDPKKERKEIKIGKSDAKVLIEEGLKYQSTQKKHKFQSGNKNDGMVRNNSGNGLLQQSVK